MARETPESLSTFEQYYALGDGRSLEKLARILCEQQIDKNQATMLSQLKTWSRQHKWVERVKKYDEEMYARLRKEREIEIQRMNERHALIGTSQQLKMIEQINRLVDAEAFGSIATVNLLKLAIDTERLARGESATQKIELTGKDGGPVETNGAVAIYLPKKNDPPKGKE